VAATLLPFYSEFLLLTFVAAGHDPLMLWGAASLGNTLGSCCNWFLGRYMLHFEGRRWFPFTHARLQRSQNWFRRYGQWSLLLSWMPVGGDGLTFVAGMMQLPFARFFILTGIGKGLRYAALLLVPVG
jgi:membrane protein YqaA with SNARE-associated domain